MRALIIAAGKGTRINTGSVILPKPLYMVGRKQLIEHVILNLKQSGIKEFVIVVGFMSEHIKYYLRSGENLGVKIKYIYTNEFSKERSGLSVYTAKNEFKNEDFILSVANHVIEPDAIKQLMKIKTKECVLAIDKKFDKINNIENATKIFEHGCINIIGENLKEYNAIDCGIFKMTPDIFVGLEAAMKLEKYALRDAIDCMAIFKVMDIKDARWTSVNTRSDIFLAEELIEQQGWRQND